MKSQGWRYKIIAVLSFLSRLLKRCVMGKIADINDGVVLSHTLTGRDVTFEVIAIRCNSKESTGKRKLTPQLIYHLLDG